MSKEEANRPSEEPLSKVYDPATVEERLYKAWEEAGCFHPEAVGPGEKFTIVIPPPNVTDRLHLGHALNNTLQDILIRWRRMQGRKALWVPGTDHAGIATQAVVERRIHQQEHKTRHDLGRDEIVRRIWAWRQECGDIILQQLRRIGSSCDWERSRFTLDPICARAVRHAFFKMFADGLIYRGKRLVNWDTHLMTAVSDDEVYHETVKGHLWHIRYPVKGQPGRFMTVATTRPETMLGDTAVAVHPDDPRYQDLIGKTVVLPLVGREIAVIADGILVDPKFGSGCVKVTPAHDPNDYEVGLRHHLEMINILTPNGHINSSGGAYEGMERFKAREKVVADLEALGLLEKVEPYQTEIGHSDRSKTPIEPYLSEQWFIKMGDLAQTAMDAVTDGRVTFHPDRYARTYLDWLGVKRDWCISRQLWWGHQIPVWRAPADNPQAAALRSSGHFGGIDVAVQCCTEEQGDFVYVCLPPGHEDVEAKLEAAGFTRDPDVLDTWFSSALWPLSTLGWPEETPDFKTFYPTDVLITAREIISLWVARMVIMGLYNVGKVPFSDVYIHAMIQDGDGRPMKKSLGNGVDPLEIIASHGADALRFTLAWMTTETQDVRMPVVKDAATGRNTSPRFDMGRNFCNKLWNATRFALMNLEGVGQAEFDPKAMQVEDLWIINRSENALQFVDQALEDFRFQAAISAAYTFFWDEFCDWYLEAIKPRMLGADARSRAAAQHVLAFVLDRALRILHPFMPFITEALWEQLRTLCPERSLPNVAEVRPSELLICAEWPPHCDAFLEDSYDIASEFFREVRDIVACARDMRASLKIQAQARPRLIAKMDRAKADKLRQLRGVDEMICRLATVASFEFGPDVVKPTMAASSVVSASQTLQVSGKGSGYDRGEWDGTELYMDLEGLIDLKAERKRLEDNIAKERAYLAQIEKKLANESFVDRAPADVVDRERKRAAEVQEKISSLERNLAELP